MRMMSKMCLALLSLTVVLTTVALCASGSDESKVLAVGKGIVVTQEELNKLMSKLSVRGRVPKKSKVLKALVLEKLFANEARKKGISNSKDDVKAAFEYRKWVVEHYKIPDVAIESYYYSHYRAYEVDGKMLPLDDTLKAQIDEVIRAKAAANIIRREGERLIKEYEVEFKLDEQKGKVR